VTEEPPIEDFPEGDPPFEEPPVGDPPLGDPPGPEDPRDPIVPAPGPVTLLGLVGAGVLGRRRRR
jgi:hypothetical protein